MSFVGFAWVLGVSMEVNGITVIDMRKRVPPMPEIIKLKAGLLSNDTFMYPQYMDFIDNSITIDMQIMNNLPNSIENYFRERKGRWASFKLHQTCHGLKSNSLKTQSIP
jgi:hypothetical protein